MTVLFLFWIVNLVVSSSASLIAQDEQADQIADEKHDEFAIVNSVGLGTRGFTSNTSFNLVDESGLRFDFKNLFMLDSAPDSIGLTDEQSSKIWKLSHARDIELKAMFANSLLAGSEMDSIESRFKQIEVEMTSVLTPEQLVGLAQIRIQAGLKRFGIEYLETPQISQQLGIDSTDIEKLREKSTQLKAKLSVLLRDKYELANRALILELSSKQQKLWQDGFDSSTKNEFLGSKLFVGDKVPKKLATGNVSDRYRMLRLKSVRDQLGLSENQTEQILSIMSKRNGEPDDDSLNEQFENSLTDDQLQSLDQIVLKKATAQKGTVGSLCRGGLADKLEVAPKQSEELFEYGKDLQVSLMNDMKQAKTKSFEKLISVLPEEKRQNLGSNLKIESLFEFD